MRLSPMCSVVVSATVALTAACGTRPSPAPASTGAFPVTLTRQGGVAGFLHGAVVSPDGHVTLTGKDDGGACELDDDTLEQLAAVARTAAGSTATTTAAHPDDLVVVLETPRGSKRLTDAELGGSASVVSRLLDDVAKAPAQRTLCR